MLIPLPLLISLKGYSQLINEVKEMLAEIGGFDGVSLQPNSGAQGEYTGLLVIRKYHESRGSPTGTSV